MDCPGEPGPPGNDDVKIEAALGLTKRGTKAEDLARGLGWTLKRTREALRGLGGRLQGTGTRLRQQSGKYRLVPAIGALSAEERRGVESASVSRSGLSVAAARVLHGVVGGDVDRQWIQNASNDRGAALATLLRLGWIDQESGGEMIPSADVRFSLGLERVSVQRHIAVRHPSIPSRERPRVTPRGLRLKHRDSQLG